MSHLGNPERDAADLKAQQDAQYRCRKEGWKPMADFPKTGAMCTILFKHNNTQGGLFWGRPPMGDVFCIRGSQNRLSKYLVPLGWKTDAEFKEMTGG